jgi:hypothetical protein
MFESNMRTVSYFVILSYSFPSQIKISNDTNGMSVLLYDIFSIMLSYVITLQLGEGENFLLSI